MTRFTLKWMTLAAAVLFPPTSFAEVSCTREGLQAATEIYITAQTKGAPTRAERVQAMTAQITSSMTTPFGATIAGLPALIRLGYVENFEDGIRDRLIDKPLKIDHHRSLLDTARCETFTEVIVSDKSEPNTLGTRLRVQRGQASEIEMVWTTTGYQGFDVDQYLKSSSSENWAPISAGERDPRATLEAVANLYMDALLGGKAEVEAWGQPCKNRTSGGYCQVGLPVAAVNIANRHYVVDETIGAVAVLCTFGADPASGRIRTPDAHVFRIENGRVRFVHAITHLPVVSPR